MEQLTADDVVVIQAGLRRRFVGQAYPQVRAVGVGTANKGGVPDPARDRAVVFYVSGKTTPRLKSQRLPARVRVGVRRGGRLKYVTLPTDVVDLGDVAPSGLAMVTPLAPGVTDTCTGGAVMRWEDGAGAIRVGILTVGHAFGPPATLGANLFVSVGQAVGVYIDKAAPSATGMDSAVVQMHGPPAVLGPVRFAGVPPQPLPEVITSAFNRAGGVSCRTGGDVVLQLDAFLEIFPLDNVGALKNVVRAVSATNGAFAKGSSGSVWAAEDAAGKLHPVAIQVATVPAQADRVGFAQVIDRGPFAWAAARLLKNPGVVPGSIRMFGVV